MARAIGSRFQLRQGPRAVAGTAQPFWCLAMVVPLIVVSSLATGCSPQVPSGTPTPDLVRHVDSSPLSEPRPPIVLTHDFGPILATGPELRHEFTLENRTNQPVRLIRPTAHTPCCSAIGPIPDSIPPGGSVRAPVAFRTGGQKGVKKLVFSVGSERPGDPTWQLVLGADIAPQWDVEPVGDSVTELRGGVSAEQDFRVVCRRRGDVGLTLPATVEAQGALTAEFVGPAEETTVLGGHTSASRLVRVTYSASAAPGQVSGILTFRWPYTDTSPRDLELRWKVTPHLSVTPKALVVQSDLASSIHSVVLSSHDRPFRVLEASGPLAGPVPPSLEAATVQTLKLTIDSALLSADGAANVLIRTDHPEQPEATLTVLLLTATKGDKR